MYFALSRPESTQKRWESQESRPLLSANHATEESLAASSPKLYRLVLPARQAYSHPASVGNR
jgi:hypothetical protein